MKPVKAFLPLSNWFLRLVLAFHFYHFYLNKLLGFNYTRPVFYIALISIFSGFLIFFSGFSKRPTLTLISAFILILSSIHQMWHSYKLGFFWDITTPALIIGICLHFIGTGNKK